MKTDVIIIILIPLHEQIENQHKWLNMSIGIKSLVNDQLFSRKYKRLSRTK